MLVINWRQSWNWIRVKILVNDQFLCVQRIYVINVHIV